MTTRNQQTEYVTVKVPYDTAKRLGLLNQLEPKTKSKAEPIATFREMAAIG